MNEELTTDTSSPDGRIIRRTMLRRMGSAGLLATAGVGLTSLLGPSAAKASTVNLPSNGSFVPGVGIPDTTNCNACITCNRDEFQCPPGGGRCPSGQCCYLCQGCGYGPYTRCYRHTCNVLKFTTCPGS